MSDKFQDKYRISSIRLQNWDYGKNAIYFVTINTHGQEHFFGEIKNGKMLLSNLGTIADLVWHEIKNHFNIVELDAFVVMPNHVHGILSINNPQKGMKKDEVLAEETRHALSQNSEQQQYKADLHIHTVLSPCADLEMSPANIVKRAKETGLQIIGITDHNSTKNAKLVKRLAKKEGIFVLCGAEITTKEEVHCLAFFEGENELDEFQKYLDEQITIIPNPDGHFGYQPVVDEKEDILEMIPHYLAAALKVGIQEIQNKVYELNGLFIPAHIDRQSNGIFSQLGFIPPTLKFDALGISGNRTEKDVRKHYVIEKEIALIRNSDAHFLSQLSEICTTFYMPEISFVEIKKALNQIDSRFVKIV